jgi:hypothetical protein
MTLDDIEQRLELIAEKSVADQELADFAQESLFREFILYVSTLKCPQDEELSRKALMVFSAEKTQF